MDRCRSVLGFSAEVGQVVFGGMLEMMKRSSSYAVCCLDRFRIDSPLHVVNIDLVGPIRIPLPQRRNVGYANEKIIRRVCTGITTMTW
jgi:hypothetical protein